MLLLGEPACGKSTIAAALALGALDEWGCSTLRIRDAEEFVKHSNPHESKQFFWIDDAFGATQFDWRSANEWNRAFPHIHAAIRRGARVVFTSRDYIYRSARNILKESALPVIQESQVVIHVEKLTKEEREQITYNHIRLGTQLRPFKRAVKPFLPMVAAHKRFSPEIARRLGNRAFTKTLAVSESGLEQFVGHPMPLLQEVIGTLDANCRSAIAIVFMRAGALPSPIALTTNEEQAIAMPGGSLAEIRNSLSALDGSLLIQVQQGGTFAWRFKHPTVRDAFAALVAGNRELMDIYLAGTPVDKLMEEVSCGEAMPAGVKVIVPSDRFQALIDRIGTFAMQKKSENKDAINRFLAYRCDKDFLISYISKNPTFIPGLQVNSYFSAISDVSVIARLHAFEILPEVERLRHIAVIRELAVIIPDAGFLEGDLKDLISKDERQDILDHVSVDLLPELDRRIDEWRDNHDGEEDPEFYFDEFKGALKQYRNAFEDDNVATSRIDVALAKIDSVIEELRSALPDEPDHSDHFGRDTMEESRDSTRSVFDDVDL